MATAEEKEGEATADAAASKMVSTETDAVVPEALAPPAVAAAKDHDGDDDNENDGADDADDNLSADLFGEDADDDDDGADAAPAPPDKAEEEADGNAAISSSSNQQDATTNTTTASSSLLSPSSEAATSAIGSPTTASSGSETFSIPKKQHSNANANANANAKILSSPSEDLPPGVPTAASIALPVGAQQHQHQQKAPVRKDSSASAGSASSSTGGAGQGNANGGKLPEGITVPESAKDLLNPRITGMLEQLPVDQMNAALQEYDEAVQQRKPIRNHPGYLSGVIRRYITLQQRITRASNEDNADESSIRPMGDHLTQAVKDAIQKKLLSTGFCTELDLDDKVGSKLKQLPERDALLAIDEISTVNRGSIRNFGSYFMGILNRYMEGSGMVAMAVVIVMVARGAATGGVMTVVEDGRITAEMIGGSTTMITETVDGLILTVDAETIVLIATETGTEEIVTAVEGGARAGHVIDVIVAQMIGTDEVEIGIGTVTAAGAVDTAPEVGRDRARQARMVENANTVETTDMDQAKDNLAGGASSPPSRPTASAPIAQGGLSQYGSFAGSAVPPPPPPRTQPPVGTRVFPRSNVLPPNAYHHAAPVPAPAMYGSVAAPAPGVYGASTVPVMVPGAANPYGPPAAASVPSAIPAHYGQVPPPLPPPVAAAPAAVPGLDLASLASQAQQALSSIHGIPPTAPAAMQKPQYTKPPMASDVTEADLPMMVQYSLKNLKTTGHIDGMLDPGICRMLQGLPETTALEALQKFQSCDTSSMRNKNAYLGGIIKRKREEAAGGGDESTLPR
eukprot:CAMPEP_0178512232 /NCGR_PEP_ID=MMETSP0696-20121128/22782_1 /TAXON_ID=265572 /ORGANISM="Extubocellulus spinifer, Strain CCMP396" /LENGTH=796 /DNA_ID=CAMNT_0020142051 /DNA_START=743 /DNA_END=3131 /DNA_ORIENTATION=+